MKNGKKLKIISIAMLLLLGCDRPEALVINEVHTDGSLTRKVILTYDKDEFDLYDCQVPVDSTWTIDKVFDVSEEGDTTWTLTAVRDYSSVDELNKSYKNYGGPNEKMNRWTEFDRSFKWFNTTYRFTEKVEKAIEGIPPSEFYTEEELKYFYMPDDIIEEKSKGPDSTLIDNLGERYDNWIAGSLVNAFLVELEKLAPEFPDEPVDLDMVKSRRNDLSEVALDDFDQEEVIDTVLGKGFYDSHRVLMDTTMSALEEQFNVAFETSQYLIQTRMPGELVSTNGYIDDEGKILWKIDGDMFLSDDYSMWAESQIVNRWAWIVTILFLLFVVVGFISRRVRRRS